MKKFIIVASILILISASSASAMVRIINYEQYTQIKKQMLTVVVIDARPKKEQDGKTIPGARVLPADEMTEQSLAEIVPSKSNPIIFYCTSSASNFSGDAANKASSYGYTNLFRYAGGIADYWVSSSKPAAPVVTLPYKQ